MPFRLFQMILFQKDAAFGNLQAAKCGQSKTRLARELGKFRLPSLANMSLTSDSRPWLKARRGQMKGGFHHTKKKAGL